MKLTFKSSTRTSLTSSRTCLMSVCHIYLLFDLLKSFFLNELPFVPPSIFWCSKSKAKVSMLQTRNQSMWEYHYSKKWHRRKIQRHQKFTKLGSTYLTNAKCFQNFQFSSYDKQNQKNLVLVPLITCVVIFVKRR